jgi:hypothetical protein
MESKELGRCLELLNEALVLVNSLSSNIQDLKEYWEAYNS